MSGRGVTTSTRSSSGGRSRMAFIGSAVGSALGNDRVAQNANPVDLDLNDVARLHP